MADGILLSVFDFNQEFGNFERIYVKYNREELAHYSIPGAYVFLKFRRYPVKNSKFINPYKIEDYPHLPWIGIRFLEGLILHELYLEVNYGSGFLESFGNRFIEKYGGSLPFNGRFSSAEEILKKALQGITAFDLDVSLRILNQIVSKILSNTLIRLALENRIIKLDTSSEHFRMSIGDNFLTQIFMETKECVRESYFREKYLQVKDLQR